MYCLIVTLILQHLIHPLNKYLKETICDIVTVLCMKMMKSRKNKRY